MPDLVRSLIVSLFILFAASCASSPLSESTGQYIDSMAVSTKVKTRLINHLGRHALSIKVKTYKNNVQLSGFVDNETIKQNAGVITASTLGVDQVRNDLIVK